jgi:hypothetical protein
MNKIIHTNELEINNILNKLNNNIHLIFDSSEQNPAIEWFNYGSDENQFNDMCNAQKQILQNVHNKFKHLASDTNFHSDRDLLNIINLTNPLSVSIYVYDKHDYMVEYNCLLHKYQINKDTGNGENFSLIEDEDGMTFNIIQNISFYFEKDANPIKLATLIVKLSVENNEEIENIGNKKIYVFANNAEFPKKEIPRDHSVVFDMNQSIYDIIDMEDVPIKKKRKDKNILFAQIFNHKTFKYEEFTIERIQRVYQNALRYECILANSSIH